MNHPAPTPPFRRILVTSALPYANGPSHIGRLTGAYLPADIYVRYQRLAGRDVLYICGSDEHGVPITIQAEKEKVTPQELVDRYTGIIQDEFARMGISFDFYSRTSSPLHHETAQEFFRDLLEKGILTRKSDMQWYDEQAGMFLSDRYVEGTCPVCQNPDARGDQCERCGTYLNQMQLIDPRSKVTNSTPVARETTHWYLPLGEFQPRLEQWLGTKTHWKDNVLNYCRGWFGQGLTDRAITRDLDWGVPVPRTTADGRPVDGANGKVLYVWFEAVLGYISATKAWARHTGDPEKWRDYWQQEDTQLVHFIGKDNIVFHALMFPAITMAYNEGRSDNRFVLVSDIPACEFLNLEGAKLSTSRNYAVWVGDYLKVFEPDPLRYTLASILPETKDSEFSWKEFQHRNNSELADILGNFIHRTVAFTGKNFDGTVPEPGEFAEADTAMVGEIARAQEEVGALIERFRIRDACRRMMDLARAANKYFNDRMPWKTVQADRPQCQTTIHISLQVVKALAILMHPFLPFSSQRVWTMLNLDGSITDRSWSDITAQGLPAGHRLGRTEIIFTKIEDETIAAQVQKLNQVVDPKPVEPAPGSGLLSRDDFGRVEMRAARILRAEKVSGSTKLLKLDVDLGTEQRQIVSGIARYYPTADLPGKVVIVVTNLKPATIHGVASQGMLLTVGEGDALKILTPEREVPLGSKVF